MDDYKETERRLRRESPPASQPTSNVQASESPSVSEEKYRGLIDNLAGAVVEIDADGRVLFISPQISNIIGLTPQEMTGRNCFQFVHPDDVEGTKTALLEALTRGHVYVSEYRIRHRQGHYVPVCSSGRVVHEAGGNRIVATIEDITDRRRVEEALHQSQRDLQARVRERTADLETANAALKERIAETERAKAALVESEAKLSRLLENLPDFVIVVDRKATIVYANRPAPEAPVETLLGATGFSFIHEAYHSVCRKAFHDVFATGEVARVEMRSVYDESLECRLVPLEGDGEVSAVMIICTDRTEQRKADNLMIAQRNLSEKLSRVSDLTEAMEICLDAALSVSDLDCGGVYLVDESGGVELAVHRGLSQEFVENVARYPADSPVLWLIQDEKPVYLQNLETPVPVRSHVFREGLKGTAVLPVFHDGRAVACLNLSSRKLEKIPLAARYSLEAIAAGIGGAIARIAAEEQIAREQELLRKLLDLHERERKLLSHEIHDGFVQEVFGAKMLLESALADLARRSVSLPRELETSRELLSRAVAEARRMMGELRPMIVDERGIVEAINYLLSEEGTGADLNIEFRHNVKFDRLDTILEGTLFRIAQEALTNVNRHSQAETVEISLTEQGGAIRLEIRDDGVGFEAGDVPADRFGLRGIRERARLFGGRACIESTPGKGTCVEVEMPKTPGNRPPK